MSRPEPQRWRVPAGVPRWAPMLLAAPQPLVSGAVRAILARPAGSPLRRRFVTDVARLGMDMLSRRADPAVLERLLRFYDPACEIHIGPGLPVDSESVYRGHVGWRAFIGAWDEVAAMSFAAEELLDMGGRCFTLLTSVRMTGSLSGAAVAPAESVWTYTVRRGLVVRQDIRNDGWNHAPAELAEALARAA